jgi:hypothetical protein
MKQHFGTIPITDLGPYEISNQVITSGAYSLSTLSTCPYVRLIGSTGAQKLFSWNERVEIPDGETARVQNASCHRGDIFINGGSDYTTLPARVTIPVPVTYEEFDVAVVLIKPDLGVDTRRARRAFFTFLQPDTTAVQPEGVAIIRGKVTNHSYNTGNEIPLVIPPVGPDVGIGYACAAFIPPLTITPMIPLGYGASFTDSTNPHTLLDCGEITIVGFNDNAAWLAFPPTAFYVLEY